VFTGYGSATLLITSLLSAGSIIVLGRDTYLYQSCRGFVRLLLVFPSLRRYVSIVAWWGQLSTFYIMMSTLPTFGRLRYNRKRVSWKWEEAIGPKRLELAKVQRTPLVMIHGAQERYGTKCINPSSGEFRTIILRCIRGCSCVSWTPAAFLT
jgi:hypothetical protein